MEVVIQRDADSVASFVADAIERLVLSHPSAVLGLATGSSPLGVYDELVRRHLAGTLSFSRVTAFLLDEYIGLPVGHAASYREFIERHFSGLVDIEPGNVHVPDGIEPMSRPPVRATRRRFTGPAASICNCWESEQMATSGSTSRRRRSHRGPGSRR